MGLRLESGALQVLQAAVASGIVLAVGWLNETEVVTIRMRRMRKKQYSLASMALGLAVREIC